jgi:excisionase family DNA binding protein
MPTLNHLPTAPVAEEDARLAETSSQGLERLIRGEAASLRNATLSVRIEPPGGDGGTDLPLPGAALPHLLSVLRALGDGKGVAVVPTDTELTTRQAADFLHVSRPYFVKLLERGNIPFRKVGPRRRVYLRDLLRYVEETGDVASQALDAMAAENQRLGLYP